MKRAIAQKEIIRSILADAGERGASLREIREALSVPIPQRTLQRRLEEMQPGIILAIGEARATRYRLLIPETQLVLADEGNRDSTLNPLPLSRESKKILALISRPAISRRPVAYHREFLENYQPNITRYLGTEEIARLFQLGQISMAGRVAGTYARNMLERLLIDLSYHSSRLEGNTYSLLDTERLIKFGEMADNKSAVESQMILNHKDAIEFIVHSAGDIDLNRFTVLNLHALLSNNLLNDPIAPGRLRNFPVAISTSVYTPAAMPQLVEEMFDLILEKARQIEDPFEQAFFIMVHLPYLQPFEDVNKRVSRLAANIPLNRHNLAPLSFVDVPHDLYIRGLLAVYELNRIELLKDVFMWAYERSASRYAAVRQTIGEPDLFRLKYREEIRQMINAIITKVMNKKTADDYIKNNVIAIPEADRAKFIEYVETELLSLHEGNFARYYVSPLVFTKWKEVWDGS